MDTMHSLSMKLIENTWLIKVAILIMVAIISNWLELIVYNRLCPRLANTSRVWDDSLIKALHKPLLFFIWLMIFSAVIPIFMVKLGVHEKFGKYIEILRQILLLLTFLWFVFRFIKNIEREIMKRPLDIEKGIHYKTTSRAIAQLLRVSILIICFLIFLQIFGISITTLLAVGGIGGIALGFAAKDTLANFLGGMMIFWDRPFSVGEWVRSPDKAIEGTIEHIGWRLTRIQTFENLPLYVPNGIFSTITIENPSRMSNRRIKTTIGLRYQDAPKIAVILKNIEEMLRKHTEIDINQTLMVNLFEFGASSLNILVYAYTKTTDKMLFHKVQQDVFLKILEIIKKCGAECAFPTTTLDFEEIQKSVKKMQNFDNFADVK